MLADGQFLVMCSPGNRPIDIGKAPAAFGVPLPHFGGGIFGQRLVRRFGHGRLLDWVVICNRYNNWPSVEQGALMNNG